MKNKYQKAFESIERVVVFNKNYNDYANDLKIVQELVDKETPMKKTIKNGRPYCAKCSYSLLIEDVWEMSYCCACGQKIDWSDDDE